MSGRTVVEDSLVLKQRYPVVKPVPGRSPASSHGPIPRGRYHMILLIEIHGIHITYIYIYIYLYDYINIYIYTVYGTNIILGCV